MSGESAASGFGSEDARREVGRVGVARYVSSEYRPGRVIHIVLFRFSEGVTQDHRDEVEQRFLALAGTERVDGERYIRSIVSGAQRSSEDAGAGMELGFVVEFSSLGDRNYYVGRPVVEAAGFFDAAHDEFKEFVGPLLDRDGVIVFDLQT